MTVDSSPVKATAAALTGAVIISFSAIWVRLADLSAVTVGLFRFLYAVPVLLVLRAFLPDTRGRTDRLIAAAAGLFLALDIVFWHEAIGQIGAGLATLAVNSQVVIVPLVTWVAFRERPSTAALTAMPVVIVGMILVAGLGREDAFGSDPTRGVVLAAAAAVFYASFLIAFRRANRTRSGQVGSLLDVTVGAAVATVAVGLATNTVEPQPTWPAHGWILALALGTQVVGWLLIGYALPRLEAARTSFIILLQPTLTLLWGRLLFAEVPSTTQLSGVGLVLIGILAVTLRRTAAVEIARAGAD